MPEDFKTRLKALRTQKNMTQEDLSKVLDIPDSTIRRYETDGGVPKRERLEIIADYFKVNIDYLLGRTDNKNDNSTPTYSNKLSVNDLALKEIVERYNLDLTIPGNKEKLEKIIQIVADDFEKKSR